MESEAQNLPIKELKSGESGGAKPKKGLLNALKRLLSTRKKRLTVENAPPEMLEELAQVSRALKPVGITHPISKN